jgi:hypothetical protein
MHGTKLDKVFKEVASKSSLTPFFKKGIKKESSRPMSSLNNSAAHPRLFSNKIIGAPSLLAAALQLFTKP